METPTIEPTAAPPNPDPASAGSDGFRFSWENLRERVISGLALTALFLTVEIIGGLLFVGLIMVAGLLMIREWDQLTATFEAKWKWIGLAYVTLPCLSLIWLRNIATEASPHAGMGIVLYLILVVAATDIGAFFTGKRYGIAKLAPVLSPNKTWVGLIGGVAAAGATGFFCAVTFTPYPTSAISGLITGMVLAFVAQAGDLVESWIKRRAGVKNSGDIIPGHGGVLDRVDGLITAALVFAIIVKISGFAG